MNEMFNERYTRLLPCFHTTCKSCLRTQIQGDPSSSSVNCPVCKKSHVVTKDINDFPKNQYIIEYIKEIKKVPKFPNCPRHGKELSLFCADVECKTTICQVCWIKEHTAHSNNVVDITEDHKDKKEALLTKVNSISKDVERTKANLLHMKKFKNRCHRCLLF